MLTIAVCIGAAMGNHACVVAIMVPFVAWFAWTDSESV